MDVLDKKELSALRDQIAIEAMKGIISHIDKGNGPKLTPMEIADKSYTIAQAMLIVRDKPVE